MYTWSNAKINGGNQPSAIPQNVMLPFEDNLNIRDENIHRKSTNSTFSSIAMSNVLCQIVSSILYNEKKIFTVGKMLTGEYGTTHPMQYMSLPCAIGENGIEKVEILELSKGDTDLFVNHSKLIWEEWELVMETVGIDTKEVRERARAMREAQKKAEEQENEDVEVGSIETEKIESSAPKMSTNQEKQAEMEGKLAEPIKT